MKKFGTRTIAITVGSLALVVVLVLVLRHTTLGRASSWQHLASPGHLSAPHAFLEDNCAACHTTVKGVDANKCITCHANNESLLQRQPTAFHADVGSCWGCHIEHQGINERPTKMNHALLAEIGLRQLGSSESPDNEGKLVRDQLLTWISEQNASSGLPPGHPRITPQEAVLKCATCHANDDRHFAVFGLDCAQCHSTTKWTIPEFRHPSSHSMDCAQCHQAPPSHYMGHFHMVSAKVAGKLHARVDQCFICHQTTSWNDIKGVGWYKHH